MAARILGAGVISFVVCFITSLCVLCLMGAKVIPFDGPPPWLFVWLGGSVVVAAVGGLPLLWKELLS